MEYLLVEEKFDDENLMNSKVTVKSVKFIFTRELPCVMVSL